jgi:hypothetical protein
MGIPLTGYAANALPYASQYIQTQMQTQAAQQMRQSEIAAQLIPALLRWGIDAEGMSLQQMVEKMRALMGGQQMKQNRAIAQRNLQLQGAQIPASAATNYLSSLVSPYHLRAMQMPTAANKAAARRNF